MNLGDLYSTAKSATTTKNKDLPPVHLWNPQNCGDIDIRIDRDGNWFHEGARITRQPLVDLFSTILKRENDEYFLVTPEEKCRIQVDVAPLLIVEWDVSAPSTPNQSIQLRTQQGRLLSLNEAHPLTLLRANAEDYPIVHIRNQLHAIVTRNVYYQMAELVEEFNPLQLNEDKADTTRIISSVPESNFLGIRSDNLIFPLISHT